MQNVKSKKAKIITAVLWALVVICMATIFFLSSQTADESADESGRLLQWLISIFGNGLFTDFIVRKAAHCLEFTGLSLLINTALYATYSKKHIIIATVLTSLYAATDEIHQLFVSGRSCELRDWGIDTCGAILGTLIFALLFLIINLIIKKQKSKAD